MNSGGDCVPTAYFGTRLRAAIAEGVFHDVPRVVPLGGVRQLVIADHREQSLSRLLTRKELRLIELHGVGLRRLGLRPEEITSTEASDYGATVQWARCCYEWRDAGGGRADGMIWHSRQLEDYRALMLFETRWGGINLEVTSTRDLFGEDVWRHVRYLANGLDVAIIGSPRRPW